LPLTVLGDAQSFAVIGNTGVTNPPGSTTKVIGNLGVITPSVTGFPNGSVSSGTIHPNDGPGAGTAINAEAAFTKAVTALDGLPSSTGLSVFAEHLNTLGSLGSVNNLIPGIYTFDTSAFLHGTLTLDAGGAINPVFVFLIPTSLTTDSLSSVVVNAGGANGGRDAGVFWVTGTSATLGDNSSFEGNILAQTVIALDPGAQIVCGRAFSQTQVTFAGVSSAPRDNIVDSLGCTGTAGEGSPTISSGFSGGLEFTGPETTALALIAGSGPGGGTTVPEPGTAALLGMGLLGLMAYRRKQQK